MHKVQLADASLDNPLDNFTNDAFNRGPFSERLAETIMKLASREGSPILGLYGRWGSGKSTVLNFVKLALNKRASGRVEVMTFNPWLFRDEEALLLDFFSSLSKAFGTAFDKPNKNIGDLLSKYSGALKSVPIVGEAAHTFAKNYGDKLSSDPILSLRNRLVGAIREADRIVVVLIDDLDRLERDEMMTLLKMVRLSANFPNVVYVLAFDEERVARLAGSAYGTAADGRQFLEKIIQYPFALPAVGSKRLVRYVVTQVTIACESAGVLLPEEVWADFRNLCRTALLNKLTTPRQAVRYANALRFALPLLKDEVDPYDQMVIEAARILCPEFYEFLRDFPDPTAIEPTIRNGDNAIGLTERALLNALLRFDRRSNKPINDPRYHDRYFSYAVAPDDLSDRDLGRLRALARARNDTALDALLQTLMPACFDSLVERLTTVLPEIELVEADQLAKALTQLVAKMPWQGPISTQEEARELAELVAGLATHLLYFRSTKSLHCAHELLRIAEPLAFSLLLWRELPRAAQSDENKNGTLPWDELRQILLDRVHSHVQSHSLASGGREMFDSLCLLNSSMPDELRTLLVDRFERNPSEALEFLSHFIGKEINYPLIAEMCDPALIIKALRRAISGRVAMTTDVKDAAQRFVVEYFNQNGTPILVAKSDPEKWDWINFLSEVLT